MITKKENIIYCTQEDYETNKLTVDEDCKIAITNDNGEDKYIKLVNGAALVITKSTSGIMVKFFDADSKSFK